MPTAFGCGVARGVLARAAGCLQQHTSRSTLCKTLPHFTFQAQHFSLNVVQKAAGFTRGSHPSRRVLAAAPPCPFCVRKPRVSYRGTSLTPNRPPYDPTIGLCPRPYGGMERMDKVLVHSAHAHLTSGLDQIALIRSLINLHRRLPELGGFWYKSRHLNKTIFLPSEGWWPLSCKCVGGVPQGDATTPASPPCRTLQ